MALQVRLLRLLSRLAAARVVKQQSRPLTLHLLLLLLSRSFSLLVRNVEVVHKSHSVAVVCSHMISHFIDIAQVQDLLLTQVVLGRVLTEFAALDLTARINKALVVHFLTRLLHLGA